MEACEHYRDLDKCEVCTLRSEIVALRAAVDIMQRWMNHDPSVDMSHISDAIENARELCG